MRLSNGWGDVRLGLRREDTCGEHDGERGLGWPLKHSRRTRAPTEFRDVRQSKKEAEDTAP